MVVSGQPVKQRRCRLEVVRRAVQPAARDEGVPDEDGEHAGEMIVAGAREAELHARREAGNRERRESFQELGDVR